jgi:hypothetical protein
LPDRAFPSAREKIKIVQSPTQFASMLVWAALLALAPCVQAEQVIQTGVPFATKDKPQSKLWYAHGSWWAWLPVKDGSGVWRRTQAGWRREVHLDPALRGLPGQADVWADGDGARAVLVGQDELAVAALKWKSGRYVPDGAPIRWRHNGPPSETATIARGSDGLWWVAYDSQKKMLLRGSIDREGRQWRAPLVMNERDTADDDICAVIALPGGIGVIWSDQAHDGVYFRRPGSQIEVVAEGGQTADDHINAAVSADGALFVAMKNSVDQDGSPQLVLRVRDVKGQWTSIPYAQRSASQQPSRPIAVIGGQPERLFLLHTVYQPGPLAGRRDWIAAIVSPVRPLRIAGPALAVQRAENTRLNDVTGPKARWPGQAPWIVLSSDGQGNVYETTLDRLP